MALLSGTRLGSYEISALLGAGGMGEVYRARDSRLSRDVALKVLPPALAKDADYMARFQREAQVLASLNHPNIAAIYGLEESGDVRALVMELVEGPTLAERMAAGAIPLSESLVIAKQIAEALEAAHDKGIVHRDLKPANIKLTHEDRVKVLDFGLAKALDNAPTVSGTLANSPTLTVHMTNAGMILGTAAYMSPEQAKGKAVDRRADIWAFGVVLIEMLSGRPAYQGETTGEILATVIKDPVPLAGLPMETPVAVRRLLDRCLDKDPKRRLRDIGEARLVLEEVLGGGTQPEPAVEGPSVRRTATLPWIAAAVTTALALVCGVGWWRSALPVSRPLMRFDVDLGAGSGAGRFIGPQAVISPDGSRVVFPAKDSANRQRLFTRLLDQADASPVNGTDGADFPFFSPDGQWLGFAAEGKLKKVLVSGGAPQTLCDAPRLRGASWGEGFIAAALDIRGPISRVSDQGGLPQPLTTLNTQEVTHRFPVVLPGSKVILFVSDVRGGNYEEADVVAQSLETGKRSVLHHGGYFPRYVPSSAKWFPREKGFLLFMSQAALFAAPMQLDGLALTAAPFPALEGVSSTPNSGGGQFDISLNGIAIYQKGGNAGETTLNWLDGSGHNEALPAKAGVYSFPALSPDGRRLAVVLGAGFRGLWIYDWDRDAMSRVSFEGSASRDNLSTGFPVWAPDGRHVAYVSPFSAGVLWVRSDGAGEPQTLTTLPGFPTSFSPDGGHLALTTNIGRHARIQILPIQGTGTDHPTVGKPEPFSLGSSNQHQARFSPDGRWISYTSDEAGKNDIYVRPYPGPGGKWQVSSGGGQHALWSPKARELFYTNDDRRIMIVRYKVVNDALVPEKPKLWADQQISDILTGTPNYDIAPDGKRFIILVHPETVEQRRAAATVTILLNFADELRRRARTGS